MPIGRWQRHEARWLEHRRHLTHPRVRHRGVEEHHAPWETSRVVRRGERRQRAQGRRDGRVGGAALVDKGRVVVRHCHAPPADAAVNAARRGESFRRRAGVEWGAIEMALEVATLRAAVGARLCAHEVDETCLLIEIEYLYHVPCTMYHEVDKTCLLIEIEYLM